MKRARYRFNQPKDWAPMEAAAGHRNAINIDNDLDKDRYLYLSLSLSLSLSLYNI